MFGTVPFHPYSRPMIHDCRIYPWWYPYRRQWRCLLLLSSLLGSMMLTTNNTSFRPVVVVRRRRRRRVDQSCGGGVIVGPYMMDDDKMTIKVEWTPQYQQNCNKANQCNSCESSSSSASLSVSLPSWRIMNRHSCCFWFQDGKDSSPWSVVFNICNYP